MARQMGEEVMLDKGLTEALSYGKCQPTVREYQNTCSSMNIHLCAHTLCTLS